MGDGIWLLMTKKLEVEDKKNLSVLSKLLFGKIHCISTFVTRMMANRRLLLGFVLVIGISFAAKQDPDLVDSDKSGWVDPGDMLNFNPGNIGKTSIRYMPGGQHEGHISPASQGNLPSVSESLPGMLKSAGDMAGAVGVDGGITSSWDCKKELEQVKQHLAAAQKQLEECHEELGSSKTASHLPFFKQYAKTLTGHFHSEVEPGNSVTYNMEVELSAGDLQVLEKFVETDQGSVQDAHAVLSNMVKRVSATRGLSQVSWSLEDTLGFGLGTILQGMCILTLVLVAVKLYRSLQLSLLQVFIKVLVLLFLVSVPWNWWHMYKMAVAKRQAAALKAVPTECRSGLQGAAQSLFGYLRSAFTFQQDECTRYQEAMVVDPMWEVAPTQAIAVTITKFFVEPAEHIGTGLGKLIKGTLQDLPLQLWPIALALLIALILVVIIMSCGYRIRFFYLFGLEPGSSRRVAGADNLNNSLENIKTQIEKLVSSQVQMEKRLESLPPVTELRPAIADRATVSDRETLRHSVSYPASKHHNVSDGSSRRRISEAHSAPVMDSSKNVYIQEVKHHKLPAKEDLKEAETEVCTPETSLDDSFDFEATSSENRVSETVKKEETSKEQSCSSCEHVEDVPRTQT